MRDYNAANHFTIFLLQLKWYIVTSYLSFITLSLTTHDKKKILKLQIILQTVDIIIDY